MRCSAVIAVVALSACNGGSSSVESGDSGSSSSESGGDISTSEGSSMPADSSTSSGAIETGTAESSTSSESSTTGGPACGDGNVDPGEECDDQNTVDGDACSAACTVPFEIAWTLSHDGDASSFDYVADLVVDADDNIYALGTTRQLASGDDVWLQQILPDGTLGWTFTWNGADNLGDGAAALAWTADGDLAIAGRTESVATGSDILVLVVDPDTQMEVWHQTFDGPGSGPGDNDELDYAEGVAVDPDGNIVVSARIRIGAFDWDAWVGEYTPDGATLRWSQSYAGNAGAPDSTNALTVDDAGTVGVVVAQNITTDTSSTILLFYDTEGMPLPADTIDLDPWTYAMEPTADGYAMACYDVPQNTEADATTRVVDADFVEQWIAYFDGHDHRNDRSHALAVAPDGTVAACGWTETIAQGLDGWVGVYRADGTAWWSDSYNNDTLDLAESFDTIAFDSTGDVIVGGYEDVFGQQANAFVRKYHPLP